MGIIESKQVCMTNCANVSEVIGFSDFYRRFFVVKEGKKRCR